MSLIVNLIKLAHGKIMLANIVVNKFPKALLVRITSNVSGKMKHAQTTNVLQRQQIPNAKMI
jgi:hypothetical protein